jgi:hypothetical protein
VSDLAAGLQAPCSYVASMSLERLGAAPTLVGTGPMGLLDRRFSHVAAPIGRLRGILKSPTPRREI